jgi:lipopolysaccharide transport system permease protein
MKKEKEWDWEVKPDEGWFHLQIWDLFQYKDLLLRFVRRDIIASYQQTILGPLWVFLQPIFTTLVYFVVFSRIAHLPTDGISPFLFYLPGSIVWNYFSDCLLATMNTFTQNSLLFSKVYFPRLIAPLSMILFQSFRLSIQLLLFLVVYSFYFFTQPSVSPSAWIILLPFLVLITACFGLGLGLLISVFTARYRDLDNILQIVIRLFMFATPVVYPVSMVPEKYQFLFWMNPLTTVIEIFRAVFFTHRPIPGNHLLWSAGSAVLILFAGLILFRKREIKVMDTI